MYCLLTKPASRLYIEDMRIFHFIIFIGFFGASCLVSHATNVSPWMKEILQKIAKGESLTFADEVVLTQYNEWSKIINGKELTPREEATRRLDTFISVIEDKWDSIFVTMSNRPTSIIVQPPSNMTKRACIASLLLMMPQLYQDKLFQALASWPLATINNEAIKLLKELELEVSIPQKVTFKLQGWLTFQCLKLKTILSEHQNEILKRQNMRLEYEAAVRADNKFLKELLNALENSLTHKIADNDEAQANDCYETLKSLIEKVNLKFMPSDRTSKDYWHYIVINALKSIESNKIILFLVLQILKEQPINISELNVQGHTFMNYLMQHLLTLHDDDVNRTLNQIQNSIDWNHQHPITHNTLLHCAVKDRNQEFIKFLLNHQANRNIQNYNNETPQDLLLNWHAELIQTDPVAAEQLHLAFIHNERNDDSHFSPAGNQTQIHTPSSNLQPKTILIMYNQK